MEQRISVQSAREPKYLPALVYAALCTSIVASTGVLLVPSIAHAFEVPVGTAQWMLTVNLLVGAVATPMMGRLSDGPHTKRLLLVAMVIILSGSLLSAVTTNFVLFLVGRAMQGVSYGIVSIAVVLVRRQYPEDKIVASISTLSITGAMGIGIGYPVTGMIAGTGDYRWAFWFAFAFVATAIVVVAVFVPNTRDNKAPRRKFDFVGALLLGLGLGILLLAISEGPKLGWFSSLVLGALVVSALILFVWACVEVRSDHPLVNLHVLKQRSVRLANGTGLVLGAALYMAIPVAALIAQAPLSTGWGLALPVFWAGFVSLPQSIGSFVANRAILVSPSHLRLPILLAVGVAIITCSAFFLLFWHNALWQLLLGLFLFGCGIGTSLSAMASLIAKSVAATELGSAVSFNQVIFTTGGSIGSAIAGSVLSVTTTADLLPSAVGIDLVLASAAGLGGALLVMLLVHNWHTRPRSDPE